MNDFIKAIEDYKNHDLGLRDLNFRIWYNNKMIYYYDFIKTNGFKVGLRSLSMFFQKYSDGILMQYIGINDVKFKNIYEKDIVVTDRGYKGIVSYNNQILGYVIDSETNWQPFDIVTTYYEVIGNIYKDEAKEKALEYVLGVKK